MSTLLIALHVTVSFALIVIVLLQMGKGAEAGASFGAGGSNTMFGSTSGGSFMGKVTAAAAVIFMLTSLTLAYFYSSPASKTVMPDSVNVQATQAPAVNPAATEPVVAPVTEAAPAEEKK